MVRFKQALAVLLICQFILGPSDLAWGQGGKGGKGGGRSSGGKAAVGGPGGKGARGAQKGGEAGEGKSAVQAASVAEDTLPGGQALSKAIVPDEYDLGPGDALTVNIWGEFDETYSVKVSPDGKISLPTIGNLEINGLTLTQAAKLLESQVHRFYRNVKTGISLAQLRVFQIHVLGDVEGPGAYLATPLKRVSDAVAQAGGVRPSGSQRQIQLQRDKRIHATADLYAYMRKGDNAANPYLRDGDVVFVPPMSDMRVTVFVTETTTAAGGATSETSVPYIIELREGERISDVMSEVGGSTPSWDLEGVFIERVSYSPEGTMRIPVDLRRYFFEKDESQNQVLQKGDQIYIPAVIKKVYVAGSVRVPASFPYVPGRSANAYITQAGGPTLVADLDRSFIKRADGTVEPYVGVAEVENGDTIVVLEKLFKTWQDYFALVGTLSGIIVGLVGFWAVFTNFGR